MDDSVKNPPGYLYQYRPPEEWALCNLKRDVMHFNSPASFNDPLDCPENPVFDNMPEAIRIMHWNNCLNPSWISPDITANDAVKRRWREMRETVGIACLSERPFNQRMWSHYSGKAKGFCLEFDTQKDANLFGGDMLHQVEYAEYPPYPDAAVVLGGDINKTRRLLRTKGKKWKDEQEWRLIREKKGEVYYDPKTLTAIYLGIAADEKTVGFVRRVKQQEQYRHVSLYRAFPMGYALGFEPLDITTYETP